MNRVFLINQASPEAAAKSAVIITVPVVCTQPNTNIMDWGPLQLRRQLQGGPCSKQSQPSVLDRATEIHPNAWGL
jgi:hypothetical protein